MKRGGNLSPRVFGRRERSRFFGDRELWTTSTWQLLPFWRRSNKQRIALELGQDGRPYSCRRDLSIHPPPINVSINASRPDHYTHPFRDPHISPDPLANRNRSSRRCHSRRNIRSHPANGDPRRGNRPDAGFEPAFSPNRSGNLAEVDGSALVDDCESD